MVSNSLVTVYIPSANYGRFLLAAIESVLKQTYKNWELILINVGSTDDSLSIMKRYESIERIKVVDVNLLPLPQICNMALKFANGKYILRLDGDDFLNENALNIMVSYLENDSNLSFVFSDYALIDEDNRILHFEMRERMGEVDFYQNIPPHGACSLWKTEVLRRQGGYREDLGSQDGFDVWSRTKDQYSYTNINLNLFYYRRHSNNLTLNNEKIQIARKQIKVDAVRDQMDEKGKILAVIPCRENYDFTKNLWSEKIGNKSLLDVSIEKCLLSELIGNIIVTCDNSDAENVVKKYGSRVVFMKRSTDSTLPSNSLGKFLKENFKCQMEKDEEIMFIKHVAAPFITEITIDEIIATQLYEKSDSALLVSKVGQQLFKRGRFGIEQIYEPNSILNSMDSFYLGYGAAYSVTRKYINRGSILGPKVAFIEKPDESNFFIDDQRKMDLARTIFLDD